MPTYIFKNNTTGEIWEEFTSFAGREEILKDENITQVPTAPAFVSGVVGMSIKTDSGFQEVLSKAAEAHPNSPLGEKYVKKGVKEVKTNEVLKKHFG